MELNTHEVRERIKEHVYPLSQQDVADLVGCSREHYNGVINGRLELFPWLYQRLMEIDVGLFLEACPEYAEKTRKRLQKIVNEAPVAQATLRRYFE